MINRFIVNKTISTLGLPTCLFFSLDQQSSANWILSLGQHGGEVVWGLSIYSSITTEQTESAEIV